MEVHIPVLRDEVIELLDIKENGVYVDLTLGRGGHSKEILKRLSNGRLIGFDQDETAIKESTENLKDYASKLTIVKSNFVEVKKVLTELGINEVDGILMDLGVSSPQFDVAERGFSYRYDGPLDMRMDRSKGLTAKTIVNTYSLNELCRVFREYGDEKYAYQIAKNIIKAREDKVIESTLELVEIIKKSKPMKELKKVGHPAKQAFQALRIEVNDEFGVLKETITQALTLLRSNGVLAIITFHSGEDRIVKHMFNDKTRVIGNRLNIPDEKIDIQYALVNRHPLIAGEEELTYNHRSKSAKLRCIRKL